MAEKKNKAEIGKGEKHLFFRTIWLFPTRGLRKSLSGVMGFLQKWYTGLLLFLFVFHAFHVLDFFSFL